MSETAVLVHADAEELAQAAAARIVVRLIDAQVARGYASLVLTGGRSADAIHRALRDCPARDAVEWSRVDVWWGDERFLPDGHPDRNETQAHATLLEALPLDPTRVHPMPASDGTDGDDPEAAAARYAQELAKASRPARLPYFDLLMLGVGEDGHVASVFPEHPVAYETRPVSAVRGSPKPPPVRITLTLPTLNKAAEVWLLATGTEKSEAVGMALSGGPGPVQLPAAGVAGVERTLWLLDRAAAAHVPPALRSLR
jgi:6-phosphogluconolactonase